MSQTPQIHKALLSVSDKSGLEELCRTLTEFGVKLYSTGGTKAAIESLGIPVTGVDEVTQFPEMMDGRVKTLHPRVFGGVLARRDHSGDMEEARRFEVPLFDLVVVNLYPFWEHRGKEVKAQTSFIDIGGPSLLRAASKNFESVTVLSDPADYAEFIDKFREHKGTTTRELRHSLAARTFRRTSRYDDMIACEWESKGALSAELPVSVVLSPHTPLRYGENPHQKAAWAGPQPSPWKVLQGKELSYNNLLDAETALRVSLEFRKPSFTIVKHNNPCGVAVGEGSLESIYRRAFDADPKSAFGGIVATNRRIDAPTAKAMAQIFLEVVLAEGFDPDAIEILSQKKNLRLIEWAKPELLPFEVRAAMGGWLIQQTDLRKLGGEPLSSVTQVPVPADAIEDLKFAWGVCKHVRSNAIVIAREETTLGIGAGQMSRVDAVEIALRKAHPKGASGAVLASDAFFPFRDNIDFLKGTGIRAIIQPGGSQRDAEVIEACNELGIAMAFTGVRHFRH